MMRDLPNELVYSIFYRVPNKEVQILLNQSHYVLFNLTFFHYCGLQQPRMGEFRLLLPECPLERLRIDVMTARAESSLAGIIPEN